MVTFPAIKPGLVVLYNVWPRNGGSGVLLWSKDPQRRGIRVNNILVDIGLGQNMQMYLKQHLNDI